MNYGFAAKIYADGFGRGWDPAAPGRMFLRATSVRDEVARALRPLWGGVWNEPQRGNAPAPGKMVDAIAAIATDRIALLLRPFVTASQIANVTITIGAPTHGNRLPASITFQDSGKKQYTLTVWVPVTA